MNKILKTLTAASLMLTVATTAAVAANTKELSQKAVTRSADSWSVSAYPMGISSGEAYDTANTNRGYCYIFCYSYSSTPSKRPIYFTSSSSYDTVTITNDNQLPSLYYKPDIKYGARIVVNYSVTGSDSRVIANGSIDG
mgnify:FL=1